MDGSTVDIDPDQSNTHVRFARRLQPVSVMGMVCDFVLGIEKTFKRDKLYQGRCRSFQGQGVNRFDTEEPIDRAKLTVRFCNGQNVTAVQMLNI